MKKKIFNILFSILILLSLTGCSNSEINKELNDAIKFKKEYESLNGISNSSGTEYRTLQIAEDNSFIYVTAEEIVKKIENKETFYVYFGSSYCPWCRSIIEKFIEVAKDNNINKVYYVDIWDGDHVEILRDTYKINKDGKLEVVSKGTEAYQKLLTFFDNVLGDYVLVNNEGKSIAVGEKRIFAPNFIYVENGDAIKLEDGISKFQTDSKEKLTEEILKDEENKFIEFFSK